MTATSVYSVCRCSPAQCKAGSCYQSQAASRSQPCQPQSEEVCVFHQVLLNTVCVCRRKAVKGVVFGEDPD